MKGRHIVIEHEKNKDKKPKKKWKKIIIIVAIVLAVLIIAGAAFVYWELSKIGEREPVVTVAPGDEFFETDDGSPDDTTVIDPEEIQWPADVTPVSDLDVLNILLIGQDRRDGESRQRSDSMIIVSYDMKDGTVKMISLMRDMYVQIPGYSDNRINVAYVFGGMELLDATIEQNFGIRIDGNFEVDFEGFTKVIDVLGGVDITLNSVDANYLNNNFGWSLIEGENHLDGDQALQYSRIRYVGNADYERTERQRNVLNQVFKDILTLDTVKKLQMLDEILPYLTTDMSKQEILNYGFTILQNGINEIESYRIPVDGTYKSASIRGMSVLVPDLEANREYLMEYIYGES